MEFNPNVIIFCEDEDTREVYIEGLIDNDRFELWFCSSHEEFMETLEEFKQEGNSPAVCFIDLASRNETEISEIVNSAWEVQKNLEFVIVSSFESEDEWSDVENLLGISDKFVFCKRPQTKIELQQFALSKCQKWSVKRQSEQLFRKLNKKLEITASAAMESARLKSIGEMASSVAHEINNPLTVIMTSTELLGSLIKNFEDSEQFEKMNRFNDKIEAQANRITTVIKSMRNMAGRNDGDDVKATQLNEMIEDFKNLCVKKFTNQNIKIEISDIPENTEILCHKSHMVQILFNLAMNSFEAMKEDLENEEKSIHLNFFNEDGNLVIEFLDNGPGFGEHDLDKVFKPFYSSKKSASTAGGLGLTVCQNIIHNMNGEINVLNREDSNGAKVIIKLPIYDLNQIAA